MITDWMLFPKLKNMTKDVHSSILTFLEGLGCTIWQEKGKRPSNKKNRSKSIFVHSIVAYVKKMQLLELINEFKKAVG